ncbi:hypothetical protein SDRG_05041 [Saprolegnia diclina VS20]|uniref:Uncharacterized protein n=1 Tax=Saprolegnia diclina (strain VS20) TaxID=1156394 RepID=T0RXQ0_SAPDV|nr:hypothetical protein SDRG_05041 [Saprolegnia diclina VS20]EQC37438.1 hypothetical protein SDRG_05041 [Saprolegnia diclina VS20]|eukprot:XP_008608958.1 hypothetical protein SDRG_05041 [Saprolegnia diclina VS20]
MPPAHVQPPTVEVVFLGTSSMMSSATRNVSGIGVSIDGDCWIFDAGEGIGLQLSKASLLLSAVSRIFVTHMHGDHIFGLMGLLLSAGNGGVAREIQVVGPPGLRRYLRRNFVESQSNMKCARYYVDELWAPTSTELTCEYDPLPFERQGANVVPSDDGSWCVPCPRPSAFHVRAAALRHTLEPCYGFVIQEHDYPGRVQLTPALRARLLRDDNAAFLRAHYGMENPLQALAMVQGSDTASVTLVDGSLCLRDIAGPTRHGRRLCILGDTCDSRAIASLAVGADVVVHECTNAFIASLDSQSTTSEEVEARTFVHGHSTPAMAGRFAAAVGASRLILTHFSRRYRDDASDEMTHAMTEIKTQCSAYFTGLVHCAHDLQHIRLPMREERTRDLVAEGAEAARVASSAADDAKAAAIRFFRSHPTSSDGHTSHAKRLLS